LDANMAREQHVKAGDTLRLSAVIKGVPFPKVSWKKEDHEVSPKADIEVTGVGSKLEIRNTVHEDGGIYSLTVENPAGSKTVSVKVVVLGNLFGVPSILTVRLPAIMRGVPVPTAKWVTDGTEIKTEGRHKIETDNYSTVLTIKDCIRKDTGEYLLTVSNAAGSKTVALHLTVLDVPGPPTGPINILEVTPEHMVISWRPPKDDGGSPIINYIVEKRQSKKETWGVVSSGTSHTKIKIPRLQKGNEYKFRIKAVNIVGEGEPRELAETVLAKDILSPPEVSLDVTCRDIITVRVGQTIHITGKVKGRPDPDITWSKDGKVLVQEKHVEIVHDLPNVELQVKEAKRSDHGKYIIAAKNSCGYAQAFAIVNVLDRPGPCQNLKISYVTKDSCMIAWENPVDNGGSEITNYIVEYRQPNQRGWSIVSSDITKRLVKANLIENREYFFRVCAENKIGPGPCIETKTPILAINPIDKPGEPENLHIAEKGKTFVYLKWRRPDYDGGSPNLSYHVERKLKDSDEWERVHKGSIKETHYMVDKCVENKIYQFRVQTKNEAGESDWVRTAEVVVKEDLQKPVLDLKLSGVLTSFIILLFSVFSLLR
uniref:Titin n=1 Tax=Apteryx owenii TaxID=8824 RepID=A0A8B9QL43_APTOW